MNQNTTKTIKNWALAERPREKMLAKGREALTDAELLAILIGSGKIPERLQKGSLRLVWLGRQVFILVTRVQIPERLQKSLIF